MSRARARIAPLVALVGAALLLPACAPQGIACPAVMYFSTLNVTLAGTVDTVDDVKICVDDDCAPSRTPQTTLMVRGSTNEPGVWVFSGEFPTGFTVRVFNGEGGVLADAVVSPDWVRTGGSAECGGPAEASVVVEL